MPNFVYRNPWEPTGRFILWYFIKIRPTDAFWIGNIMLKWSF